MVKRIFIYCLTLCLFISCLSYKNENGQKRFKYNRFTIKPNTNNEVFKFIDTTSIYKIIWSEDLKYNQTLEIANPTYLKFYKNGRVAKFYNYSEEDITSLDPKKARMALYNYDNDKLVIEVYFTNPQGGGLVKDEYLVKQKNDTLELKSESHLKKYKIIPLPKEFLNYKPDW